MRNVDLDFANDARGAIESSVTPGAWKIVLVTALMLGAGVAWANSTHVGQITTGVGRVIPSSQVQVVQSLEPGIVAEIMVKAGDTVEAGQNLIRIDDTGSSSQLGELRQRQFALAAEVDRLSAQARKAKSYAIPKASRSRRGRITSTSRRASLPICASSTSRSGSAPSSSCRSARASPRPTRRSASRTTS